jgi:hypothetical protein
MNMAVLSKEDQENLVEQRVAKIVKLKVIIPKLVRPNHLNG